MIKYFKSIIDDIKNFKYYGKALKKAVIWDMIYKFRNLISIPIGVGLYLLLHNTGLLIYLILIIKCHYLLDGKDEDC